MSKELEDFSSLFDLTPSISILHYVNIEDEVTRYLISYVASLDGKITTITNLPNIGTTQKLVKSSSYDYIVISQIILQHQNQNSFMKIITKGLRDSGYIIILEEKGKSLDTIYNLLDEFDYGAVSKIDIFKKYELIMAKKLHMWGMD
jgi:hypothetical protein